MADEKLQFTLMLATQATGTGAKDTAADMRKLADATQDAKGKANVAEIAYYDLDAQIAKSGNTIERAAVTPIKSLSKAASQSAPGVANLGMVATQVGYQVTDFATQVSMGTSAITAFAQQAPQAIGALTQFGGASGGLKAILGSSIGLGTAISLSATAVALGAKLVIDEYGRMTAAIDNANVAEKRWAEDSEWRREQQLKLDQQTNRDFLSETLQDETDAMERQGRALQRILNLRSQLGNIQSQLAGQEVEMARQRGGDVALAEANALAADLQSSLEQLNGELQTAQQSAASAKQKSEAAFRKYVNAMNEGAGPEEVDNLSKLVDEARTAEAEANQEFAGATQKFNAQRKLAVQRVEIGLAQKEEEYSNSTSQAAKKAFDGVYESLKTAMADAPAAIQAIASDASGIATAVTAKTEELKTASTTAAAASAQAVQTATTDVTTIIESQTESVNQLKTLVGLLKTGQDGINTNLASLITIQNSFIAGQSATQSQINRLSAQLGQEAGR